MLLSLLSLNVMFSFIYIFKSDLIDHLGEINNPGDDGLPFELYYSVIMTVSPSELDRKSYLFYLVNFVYTRPSHILKSISVCWCPLFSVLCILGYVCHAYIVLLHYKIRVPAFLGHVS